MDTVKIDGITYAIEPFSGDVTILLVIGKRGKPTKRGRAASFRDGRWILGGWVRL